MKKQEPRVYALDRDYLLNGQKATSYCLVEGEPEKVEPFKTLDELAARLAKIPKSVKIDFDSESTGRIVSMGLGGSWVNSARSLHELEQHYVRMKLYDPSFKLEPASS